MLAWLWSYVLPTVSTVRQSFQRDNLINPAESVGTRNYEHIFDSGASIVGQIGFALLLGLVPLAMALLAAPLLAIVADRAGRAARLATRGVLALPIAGYAPAALLIGLRFHHADSADFAKDIQAPRGWLTSVVAQTTFGLVIAVATTLYLSALRRREAGRRSTPALLTVGGLLVLGVLASALQIYTVPAITTGGGPRGDSTTPVLGAVQSGFRTMQFGVGAATSTVLLVVLGLLGLGAVALILVTRFRIEFDGWRDRHATVSEGAPTAAARRNATQPLLSGLVAVALVAFLGILGWALEPWLRGMFSGGTELPARISTSTVLANTWLPPLLSALVSIAVAALAGFGIGALRPLGRWSELLLVPFAPWLFVGIGPLGIAGFARTRDFDQINTLLGLIPPVWLSVPGLFAFTLLFRGQHARWRAGGGFGRTLVLPALPMLAVTFLVTWLFSAQQPLWASLVARDVRHMPAPVLVQMLSEQFGTGSGPGPLGLVLPLPLLVLFVLVFAALQIGYLDRLAIRIGTETLDEAPPSGGVLMWAPSASAARAGSVPLPPAAVGVPSRTPPPVTEG